MSAVQYDLPRIRILTAVHNAAVWTPNIGLRTNSSTNNNMAENLVTRYYRTSLTIYFFLERKSMLL